MRRNRGSFIAQMLATYENGNIRAKMSSPEVTNEVGLSTTIAGTTAHPAGCLYPTYPTVSPSFPLSPYGRYLQHGCKQVMGICRDPPPLLPLLLLHRADDTFLGNAEERVIRPVQQQ